MSTPDPERTFIKLYRGYEIWKIHDTHFDIMYASGRVTSCGSAWSCISYIDEMHAP